MPLAHLRKERMEAAQVPVDLLHWLLAISSIIALLVFLVPLRWRAPEAAAVAMFTAAIVALTAFFAVTTFWPGRLSRRSFGDRRRSSDTRIDKL
jgi:uncharacterized membrane protein YphA (DoxX/SURF4 family)